METNYASFDRDKLIEQLFLDSILLRAKTDVLHTCTQTLFDYFGKKTEFEVIYKAHLQKSADEILLSYPEIDKAIHEKLKDDLGL